MTMIYELFAIPIHDCHKQSSHSPILPAHLAVLKQVLRHQWRYRAFELPSTWLKVNARKLRQNDLRIHPGALGFWEQE